MCLEYIFFVQATSAANVDGESRRITALYTEDTYLPHQNKPTETGLIPLIAGASGVKTLKAHSWHDRLDRISAPTPPCWTIRTHRSSSFERHCLCVNRESCTASLRRDRIFVGFTGRCLLKGDAERCALQRLKKT